MDMVEKVARALCASTGTIWGGPRGEDDPDWLMVKAMFYRQARAALEAMREPDEAMKNAAEFTGEGGVVNFERAWATAIDAALTPIR